MKQGVFAAVFRIRELRARIFFTLSVLTVFRFGSVLTVPSVDPRALSAYFRSQVRGNAFADYMDFFVGGAFSNFSVFMLGVMPYISTQILMQLSMIVFPNLKKVVEDVGGRRRVQFWTRVATVFVCLIQSSAVTVYANQIPGAIVIQSYAVHLFVTMLTVTSGSMITLWLGEQITARGIGNGVSMIIFSGIVARLPHALAEMWRLQRLGELNMVFVIVAFVMFVGIIVLVVYEQQGQRKIPIHYARRVVGRKMYGGQSTYIPFKINPSGVIPIIFASSFLTFPLQIASSIGPNVRFLHQLAQFLRPNSWWYNAFYVVLIVFFAYFYTQVTLNPTEIAKQIRENGGTIPGIRADKTEEYLQGILNRLVLPGSLYLGMIAVLPTLIQAAFGFPSSISLLMGGTSLLILVGVDLDTMSQIEAQLKMRQREGLGGRGKVLPRSL